MGGDIAVSSEVGKGTRFAFDVALSVTTEAAVADRKAARVVGLAPGQVLWRILVVDDSRDNRRLLTGLLDSVGFETREASNGSEAVDIWKSWRPHFIWMDMRMPVMDGYEATREIRRLEESGSEPCRIVALTASAFEHEREGILETGCDDFVTKPFREATIFAKLSEHLGAVFVREDSDAPEQAAGADDLTLERVRALPTDLLADLRASLEAGDVALAGRAVDRIEPLDSSLAVAMRRSINAYAIDELLDLVGSETH
jgi:CheY-like chemotaxis protein